MTNKKKNIQLRQKSDESGGGSGYDDVGGSCRDNYRGSGVGGNNDGGRGSGSNVGGDDDGESDSGRAPLLQLGRCDYGLDV